jgi:alanyl-tRNA synthetase
MNRKELINKYIEFFKSKNHKEIENHSLIPDNDPTVLFTTAGMHPIVPYLLGQVHPSGKRLCNVQRCIFEMLGNWSLGDYWKKEAIGFSFEFLTKILKIPTQKLAVSCFKGNNNAKKDEESAKIWRNLGIPTQRIVFLPKENNWWETQSPGPCGPDTEMFYWRPNKIPAPEVFDPNDNNWIEIWNDVLMQYNKDNRGNYNSASQKNIDTGMGVERTITVLTGLEDNYLSDSFLLIIKKIEEFSKKTYGKNNNETHSMRILADHIKASVFLIADGIFPSNSGQGYVLRRLIRRSARYGKELGLKNFIKKIAEPVFEIYNDYEILDKNKERIFSELEKEETKFLETLEKGIKEFERIARISLRKMSGKDAFLLYQSYGFPIEITKDLAKEKNILINETEFNEELKKHQELSRTATEGKFKSGLVDFGNETTKLHTATHLLHAALRKLLGNEVSQKGSNITNERLRFDFSFNRKLTFDETKKIEDLINEAIAKKLNVTREEMSTKLAKESGALGFFENKYSDIVSVYTIGDKNDFFSKEICSGPHVDNLSKLGHFKILKEEACSAGVRRIKAVLN